MNYIELINHFWQTRRIVRFSSNEADLYYFLIQESNIRGWENPFECPNGLITASIGISEKTLIEVRNRLQQKGLISFERGQRKRKSPVYTILYCNNESIKVGNSVSKKVSKTVSKKVNLYSNIYNKTKTETKTSKSHSSANANGKKKSELVFWKEFIEVWNNFYLKKLENEYNYLAKDFGSFKKIHGFLKKRIDSKNREFTQENLMETFKWFLEKAWEKDEWLRQNFTVSNVLSQFNQIVNESKTNQNGKSNSGQRGNGSGKLSGRATINPDEDIQEFA